MSQINQALAKVITKQRNIIGISQEELAARAEVHRTYISQIERGLKSPTLPVLFRIAKALNTTASNLISSVEKEIYELQK
ncbi:TPA: helix-turn-helix transcriptional regulator [Pseudomonas aeruginosa]|uniref:helix-turn-helix domain-containing protein n=1 Tax=Pseudomonas aeruginosa TaxID=287 RepID=UPI00370E9FDA|nr:helix-turn-helix transcriptional regulator [Pseudomonas aeruginosa]HCA5793532.1 helix-turn-helix transcriptional regulator [Pseudomonas aeruginosa]HCA5800260.1 helix-turn-helix transcriptional regulator [Pseudomonas aeruginosa]HCA5827478.1 helix-turn-helix transcriptional regulator [Pseudomonas aeruginosa]HCA5852007.1 helix-turn-helix transcriptional regulator [Pseudomonas aeruginosa]